MSNKGDRVLLCNPLRTKQTIRETRNVFENYRGRDLQIALLFNGITQCCEGSISGSSSCKLCLHKCASKYGSRGQLNIGKLFTNRKLLSIHSESVPKSRSKVCRYTYAEKNLTEFQMGVVLAVERDSELYEPRSVRKGS